MDNEKQFLGNDALSFTDDHVKHGLRGHVTIVRENTITKEKSVWYEDDNIIPISGYQYVLMKMFGLFLDSNHKQPYENIGKDTTLVIPDLNNTGVSQFGVDPEEYTTMGSNIDDTHFVQGFMIGNGGSGEDAITTKNTDYSFTKLRNPIPFQQTSDNSLNPALAGKYLGKLRTSASNSYYIKKFDETPHIYHSWWRDGQKWDYVDPVSQNDLGPNSVNGVAKTNRIETYAQCIMSLSDDDCISYFSHSGSTQTATVNELGLVAFDSVLGVRSIVEKTYDSMIKELIRLVFDNNRGDVDNQVIDVATNVYALLKQIEAYDQTNIQEFIQTIHDLSNAVAGNIDYESYQTSLSESTNIEVEAFYNQNGILVYTEDKFVTYLSDDVYSSLTTDEAQRIKLITYYTFKPIPLQSNWRNIIYYRIYAN